LVYRLFSIVFRQTFNIGLNGYVMTKKGDLIIVSLLPKPIKFTKIIFAVVYNFRVRFAVSEGLLFSLEKMLSLE